MLERSRAILAEGREFWPLASRWLGALEKAYQASDARWPEDHDFVSAPYLVPGARLTRLSATPPAKPSPAQQPS